MDERELCDLECLTNGSFAPLTSYMTRSQYDSCVETMFLSETEVFPMPIVCMSKDPVPEGTLVTLRNLTGTIFSTLLVEECWKPDLEKEWQNVFGTTDSNHPYIQYMKTKLNNDGELYYLSGNLTTQQTSFHNNFAAYRNSPAVLRAQGPWIGFQTRNPLHRSHIELIRRSVLSLGLDGLKILLHPVEGVTQECDIPFPVRMKCYKQVLTYMGNVTLSILPLSMRMAGPREAVWHAVIRRNYGCSHFIVGRDHAGPSYKTKEGNAFYDPLAAQQLAKSLETQIGITIVTSEEVVYCEEIRNYVPVSESQGYTVKQISGTKFRSMLETGESIPEWFSEPEVVKSLKEYYNKPKGVCVYFIGLSGSGKTTLAMALKGLLEEEYPNKELTLLDADEIRTHLSKGLGFSREDRSMNVRRIGFVASEIVKHGGIVLVANIAPYEEDRQYNRRLITQTGGEYLELYVDTPLGVCEARDVKGLYKAARAGTIPTFTGISDPFEFPTEAIVIPYGSLAQSTQMVKEIVFGTVRNNVS